jgi:putative transposase
VASKARSGHVAQSPHPVVGVDVGVKDLLVVATTDGVEVDRIVAPKSLDAAGARLQALQRRAARQHGPYDPLTRTRREPSIRWQRTQLRIARLHARAAHIRNNAIHHAATALTQNTKWW